MTGRCGIRRDWRTPLQQPRAEGEVIGAASGRWSRIAGASPPSASCRYHQRIDRKSALAPARPCSPDDQQIAQQRPHEMARGRRAKVNQQRKAVVLTARRTPRRSSRDERKKPYVAEGLDEKSTLRRRFADRRGRRSVRRSEGLHELRGEMWARYASEVMSEASWDRVLASTCSVRLTRRSGPPSRSVRPPRFANVGGVSKGRLRCADAISAKVNRAAHLCPWSGGELWE